MVEEGVGGLAAGFSFVGGVGCGGGDLFERADGCEAGLEGDEPGAAAGGFGEAVHEGGGVVGLEPVDQVGELDVVQFGDAGEGDGAVDQLEDEGAEALGRGEVGRRARGPRGEHPCSLACDWVGVKGWIGFCLEI